MQLRSQVLPQKFFAPAEDPPADPPVTPPVEPPVTPPADPPADPPIVPPVVPPATDWKDKRIAELTAKLNNERAAKAAAPAPVAPAPAGESPEAIQARIDAAANAKAVELAAMADWNNRCNAVAEQGQKEYKDFGDRLKAVQGVANFADPVEFAQFNSVIQAAMETGEAHKLIHALGETPGEVKRLMLLSPMKMAMEMATRAAKIGAGPPAEDPSGLGEPIEPLGSRGKHYDGLDPKTPNGVKLPIGEWMKQREKQAEAAGIQ